MNYNKSIISGNITRQPELKVLDSGVTVTQLSVAINSTWTDKSGQKQEATDFIDVSVFGKQAENCVKYLVKGQNVLVEGKIKNRSWEKSDGTKGYKTSVVADMVQFGSKPQGSDKTPSQDGEEVPEGKIDTNKGSRMAASTIEYPTEDINPNDIPF